jgi:soluble lytic murein transglycosylase-like protein
MQARLLDQINPTTAISLVSGWDRFDSDNDLFDAERYQGGVIMTINY